jgi:Animal haem peroxidase
LGLPTWMQMRQKCGLDANFNSFADLRRVLKGSSVDLLEKNYESVKDIDLYVGGGLESFENFGQQLLGPTFGCIFKDQYERMISGDAYFFTHANNPYPFTQAQLNAITEFSLNGLMCSNTDLEFTNKEWVHIEDATNPKVACSTFAPMNLQPWLNV